MPEFHETKMGRYFYDGNVPRLIRALERIADALEKQNEMKDKEVKESKKVKTEKKTDEKI